MLGYNFLSRFISQTFSGWNNNNNLKFKKYIWKFFNLTFGKSQFLRSPGPLVTFSWSPLSPCDVKLSLLYPPFNLIIVENLSVFAKNSLLTIFCLDLFYHHFQVGIIITWKIKKKIYLKIFNIFLILLLWHHTF